MEKEDRNSEEFDSSDLLSADFDDFLDAPDTTTVLRIETQPEDERNVCVAFDNSVAPKELVKELALNLHSLCAMNRALTDTHKVAVLMYWTDSPKITSFGYCDELSAREVVYRLSKISGIDAKVYQDFNTSKVREVTEADLGKRPFRF